jgi:endonuclease/exonuclease/phosphatase family metal-dependent hydrolase
MSARISDYNDVLYSRELSNDLPVQTDLIKRTALAAIPFLSLCPLLRFPISLTMGSLRVWNTDSNDVWQKVAAITALAGSLFQHRIGIACTTVQDLFLEINKIKTQGTSEDSLKGLIRIFNHLVYLGLISFGGLELSIVAFAIQIVINLLQSKDEFQNDRWIEGFANLLMCGIRLQQTYNQCQQLTRKWEIEKAIKKIHVGELHEKWRFPSDHLPVGIEVNGIRIISWNVLNNAYMEWVTDKDSQGLNGSLISELDIPIQENGLTKRDVFVAEMIQTMMAKGQIVALQECSEPFLEYLKQNLPSQWDLVRSFDTVKKDQDVILYNTAQLAYCSESSETTNTAYPSVPGRPLQNVYFSRYEGGSDLRIINAHIPGDPTLPGREEFAEYVYKQHQQGLVTIALGDNNFERDEMIDAYRKAGFTDFSIHSPWKTNIDPYTKESKAIDHLFVMGDEDSRDLRSDEILVNGNLQESINLLNQERV